tara:strand:+ start:22577 stop:22828 length:252 start_codon:yes stop_codon:yes gene_type:complete
MLRKIRFQDLPENLQDELRDAPIQLLDNGRISVEWLAEYEGRMHQFMLELQPRTQEPHSIIYVTQDLQDMEVSFVPVSQSMPA